MFCQLRSPFYCFWKQKFRFLPETCPTNEQTFCWAMSKPKGFLLDWGSPGFSGCIAVTSTLCSQSGLGDSPKWKYMQGAHAKIRPRDQSPLTRITQVCIYHFSTFLHIYIQYFHWLLLVEILFASGNTEKINRFQSQTRRKWNLWVQAT